MKTRLLESVPKYPQTVRGTCEYSQLPKSTHIYSHNPAQTLNPHRTAKVKQRWSAVRDDERKAQGFVGGTLSLSLSGGRAPWTPRTKDGWVWRGGATMLQCSKSKCFAVVQMFCSSQNVCKQKSRFLSAPGHSTYQCPRRQTVNPQQKSPQYQTQGPPKSHKLTTNLAKQG